MTAKMMPSPAFDKVVDFVTFMTEYRIADMDPAPDGLFLHDHKVFAQPRISMSTTTGILISLANVSVATQITTGPHADAFHVALHVEHGEALDADKILIGVSPACLR